VVIEFKRGVYQLALQELSRFIHRNDHVSAGRQAREQKTVDIVVPAELPAETPGIKANDNE
jgi:hypothetical protein